MCRPHGHRRPHGHSMSHCGCCHGGPGEFQPPVLSEEEKTKALEKYKESLEKQLERVNERLDKLKD